MSVVSTSGASPQPRRRLPAWLKWLCTLCAILWLPVMLRYYGAQNQLWLCELDNLLLVVALWLESRLLFSALLVGLLLVDLGWMVDLLVALLTGLHPFAATATMFTAALPLPVRLGSLFHLTVPVIVLYAVLRLGYDRRGFWWQTGFTALALLAAYLLTPPAANVNWVWGPGGCAPQPWLPAPLYLLICAVAYPLLLYLPVHLAARRWLR